MDDLLFKNNMLSISGRATPNTPPSSLDVVSQVRVLENDSGIVLPWTSQVVVVGGDAGIDVLNVRVVDHIPRWVAVRGTSGCSDGSGGNGADVVVLKPGLSGLTEDEVDGTDDETFGIELSSGVGKNSILVSDELGSIISLVCGVYE